MAIGVSALDRSPGSSPVDRRGDKHAITIRRPSTARYQTRQQTAARFHPHFSADAGGLVAPRSSRPRARVKTLGDVATAVSLAGI
jgi:hypothetical protein